MIIDQSQQTKPGQVLQLIELIPRALLGVQALYKWESMLPMCHELLYQCDKLALLVIGDQPGFL